MVLGADKVEIGNLGFTCGGDAMTAPRDFKLSTMFAIVFAVGLMFVSPGPSALADSIAHEFEIRTLSTRSNMVSDGVVLVEVRRPSGVQLSDLRVTLNGQDVTNAFRQGHASAPLVGLIEGL